MREIKFRAWTHKGFIYRELPYNGFMATPIAGTPQPRDWQQYTGLKDKNGVEIYEGDIVSSTGHDVEHVGLVKWHDDYFAWGIEMIPKRKDFIQFYVNHQGYFEVIGNIYENPALLEATEDSK